LFYKTKFFEGFLISCLAAKIWYHAGLAIVSPDGSAPAAAAPISLVVAPGRASSHPSDFNRSIFSKQSMKTIMNPRNWDVGSKITVFTFGLISVILALLLT
jgi:hypothetical protein